MRHHGPGATAAEAIDPRDTPVGAPSSRRDANAVGLRYVSDASPGIRRIRRGRGFSYRAADGSTVRDPVTLRRIRALAVPPAWTDVWICASETGHLQATGRDARGRKQYRYHTGFRARRDADKYDRLRRFARSLARIRRRVAADLARDGLPREKVLAATVRLLERTLIRVGNDGYARDNGSYGLATLQDRHARVAGGAVHLRFRGKSGRMLEVEVRDHRLAAIVRRCQELPGQDLFQYVDPDGQVHDVRSDDVNDYIREAAGSDEFSAKDFRTWAGTVTAARALARTGRIGPALRAAAERLGNTPAVTRSAYVHPAVIESAAARGGDAVVAVGSPEGGERGTERRVLRMLDRAARASRRRDPAPAAKPPRARPARPS